MSLKVMLEEMDKRWSPARNLISQTVASPGYHTKIVDGATAHSTREAGDYAIGCLQSGEPWRIERAASVLRKLASMQVTNPCDPHFGIWGWFAEEPPEQMAPADWNWADFMGVRFAQCLIAHAAQLDATTTAVACEALRRAAWSIFRRNVGPSYTNIAVMGGVACAAAGEILKEPLLLDYGRLRLQSVLKLVSEAGGFSEYNSPTYTRVVLEECERAIHLLQDTQTRDAAEAIRKLAWQTIAEHFHPGTQQVTGPQSRAYGDRVNASLAKYLTETVGIDVTAHKLQQKDLSLIGLSVVPALPCPTELRNRFTTLPDSPMTIHHRFGSGVHGDMIGTSWFCEDACLGSINRGLGWVQQRPVLGYWRTDADSAICLRVRVLKDGRDFASSYLWTTQVDHRLIGSITLASQSGDHHVTLDKPHHGIFPMRDLRIRIQLHGSGAIARAIDDRFQLAAGKRRVVVHAGTGCTFESTPVRWAIGQDDDVAYIDAIFYTGEERQLDSNSAVVRFAYALEMLAEGAAPASDRVIGHDREHTTEWQFGDLRVTGSRKPVRFAW